MTTQMSTTVNGIDTDFVRNAVAGIAKKPATGMTNWRVRTRWMGGARTRSHIETWQIGGETRPRGYTLETDEPEELGGTDTQPNPQEMLLSALNGCMMVGYATECAMRGIEIRSLEIQTDGDIDLRGFLKIDPSVPTGYQTLHYTVTIDADATDEQLQKVHEAVTRYSPNRFTVANAVQLESKLVRKPG